MLTTPVKGSPMVTSTALPLPVPSRMPCREQDGGGQALPGAPPGRFREHLLVLRRQKRSDHDEHQDQPSQENRGDVAAGVGVVSFLRRHFGCVDPMGGADNRYERDEA